MTLVLVTGGVRSGKSRLAESLFAGSAGVLYVATGPESDDPDWAERVSRHQARRPAGWSSLADTDPAAPIAATSAPVLLDCLGTWATAALDRLGAWDRPSTDWRCEFDRAGADLVSALTHRPADTVVVTNEVGWGVVPAHRSGRLFADQLGLLNQQVAQAADVVLLTVSGLVVAVKGAVPPDGALGC